MAKKKSTPKTKTSKKTKKTIKKTAKKSVRKLSATAKKPAKKTVKKAAKTTAKKTAKKALKLSSKTAAKKTTTPKAKTTAPRTTTPVATPAQPEVSLVGNPAPEVTVLNHTGETLNLAETIRSTPKVVLYFYPKDDTPGCTTEACNFRDNLSRLESSGVKVIGVSPDSPESHQSFKEKYSLNFDLLSDTDHKLAETFNVWKEKNFMGRKYMGVERSTFLFDNGVVSKVWQPVKVEGHVDEILTVLGA